MQIQNSQVTWTHSKSQVLIKTTDLQEEKFSKLTKC